MLVPGDRAGNEAGTLSLDLEQPRAVIEMELLGAQEPSQITVTGTFICGGMCGRLLMGGWP